MGNTSSVSLANTQDTMPGVGQMMPSVRLLFTFYAYWNPCSPRFAASNGSVRQQDLTTGFIRSTNDIH